jgi:glycosyltransferase involved in cell wall biosynthesis
MLNERTRYSLSGVIALSEFMKTKIVKSGLREAKVYVKSNFLVPLQEFNSSERELDCIFVGRLANEKGIRTLLAAWELVDEKYNLNIVGKGELESLVKTYAEKYDNIHYLGFQTSDRIKEFLLKSKLLIMPSEWYEGFPITILEAFQCGTPVLASNLGVMQSIIQEGESGWLFEAGNSSQLAEKVDYILSDRENIINLSSYVKSEFDRRYTDDINYKMLEEIYLDIIEKNNQQI